MYYNDTLTSWSIIKGEIGKANSKHHTLAEFKLGNKIIHINHISEAINNYFFNLVDELNIQQANTESAILSSGEKFPNSFPKIINVPIIEVEITCTITSLKNKKIKWL
jgi:hypothetical protein